MIVLMTVYDYVNRVPGLQDHPSCSHEMVSCVGAASYQGAISTKIPTFLWKELSDESASENKSG